MPNTIHKFSLPATTVDGTFTLSVLSSTTTALDVGCSADDVALALDFAIPGADSTDLQVSLDSGEYTIEYKGIFENQRIAALTVDVSNTIKADGGISLTTLQDGDGSVPEQQRIVLTDSPLSGTWRPQFGGPAVAYDATADDVKDAIIASGHVVETVTKDNATTWTVEWPVANGDQAELIPVNVDLMKTAAGDAATVTVVQYGYFVETMGVASVTTEFKRIAQLILAESARTPISVDQPLAGDWYPFLDVGSLYNYVADFYLSYSDVACAFTPPFKIAWAYGFGTAESTNPGGYPTPSHEYDVLITDANDEYVFNSTTATEFYKRAWADRMVILEWRTNSQVCRVVLHTAWKAEDTPVHLPEYLVPTGTELDPRTIDRLPERVDIVTVENRHLQHAELQLENGYNTELVVADASTGVLTDTEVTISAEPGTGIGPYPCDAQTSPRYVTTFNGVDPTKSGSFYIDTDHCYRLERPTTSWTGGWIPKVHLNRNALKLTDDCVPCCSCEDFTRVYEAISRQWESWLDIATLALNIRGQLVQDVYRLWNDQAALYADRALKVILLPVCPCALTIAAAFCNQNFNSCITSGYFSIKIRPIPLIGDEVEGFQERIRCNRTYLFVVGGNKSNVYSPQGLTLEAGEYFTESIGEIPQGGMVRLNATFMWDMVDCYDLSQESNNIEVTIKFHAIVAESGPAVWQVIEAAPLLSVDANGECCPES